jgi:hypothetical protein
MMSVGKGRRFALSQEEREELSQHNTERHDWIEEVGAQDRRVSSRGYQRLADLWVSTTDPDATLMLIKQGADMGYHTHYVVDGGKARIIYRAGSYLSSGKYLSRRAWRSASASCQIPKSVFASGSDRSAYVDVSPDENDCTTLPSALSDRVARLTKKP